MPIPEFVAHLRARIGHDPLWLIGVTAVVEHDGRILLARPVGSAEWTAVSGIVEPGEHPAVAAVREVLEETGVVAEIERLASVSVTAEIVYPNGDRSQYTDLCFRCRYVSGVAHVADDESDDVGWFAIDDLPPLRASAALRIRHALSADDQPALDLTVA